MPITRMGRSAVALLVLLTSVLFTSQSIFVAVAEGANLGVTLQRIDTSQFPTTRAYVSVANSQGVAYSDVPAQAFEILEDGQPVAGLQVKSLVAREEPVAIALVVDVSGSMNDANKLGSAKQAASAFVDTMAGKDVAAVVSFSNEARLAHDFTGDKGALKNAVAQLTAKGETSIYDAVSHSAQELAKRPEKHRVLLLLTDGEDTTSKQPIDASIAAAKAAAAPIYAVGLGKDLKKEVLDKLASATAGQAIHITSPDQLKQVYVSIGEQLRHQYALQYTSRLTPDDASHVLIVRVKHRGEEAEARGEFTLKRTVLTLQVKGLGDNPRPSGVVKVEATVSPIAPRQVELLVDGELRASASAAPYVLEWDAAREKPGSHKVIVRARGVDGFVADREFSVEVPAPTPTPTATPLPTPTPIPPTPTPEPTPTPAPLPQSATSPLPYGIAGVGMLVVGGGVTAAVLSRRRKPAVEPPTLAAPEPESIDAPPLPEPGQGAEPLDPTRSPRARLHVRHHTQEQEATVERVETVLGREASNPIVIRDPLVSRHHARIVLVNGEFWIEDLKSLNGTRVNGDLVTRRRLSSGDQIRIGEAVITFGVEQPD